jgi:hypothetical protein
MGTNALTRKVRINLAHPQELLELPGLGPEHADAILKFRVAPRTAPSRTRGNSLRSCGGYPWRRHCGRRSTTLPHITAPTRGLEASSSELGSAHDIFRRMPSIAFATSSHRSVTPSIIS